IHIITKIECGLAKISAKRINGQFPSDGSITLVQPGVDMLENFIVLAGNKTLRPDEGADYVTADLDYANVLAGDGSAWEHQIINSYFKQSDSISSVKLLQIAQKGTNSGGPGVLFLNKKNYINYGTSNYNGIALSQHDVSMWQSVT